MLESMTVRLEGIAPLLMNNSQMADPLNDFSKKIAAIRAISSKKRTDEDLAEMLRLQWYGGLYVDDEGHPCIPGENLEQMLVEGGKKFRKGPQFKAAVLVDGNIRVEYSGPQTPDALWKDSNFRKVSMVPTGKSGRAQVCYPMFSEWAIEFTIEYDAEQINGDDIVNAMEAQGKRGGLGAWRPKHGRFKVIVISRSDRADAA